ncbi:uncharacterized protein LOC143227503 [Tachypleus tridentatus]|uniref:uncharacterized protein LOC143227503 n=1 Tax=Tachypleus tridentatus TaxID=6853 RepID=UPI003FD2DCF3
MPVSAGNSRFFVVLWCIHILVLSVDISDQFSFLNYECPEGNRKPNRFKCYVYYECVNGDYVRRECPEESRKFDSNTKTCVAASDCTNEDDSQSVTGATQNDNSTDGKNGWFPVETSCSLFEVYEDGVGSIQSCFKGEHFDVFLRECVNITKSNCFEKGLGKTGLVSSAFLTKKSLNGIA